MSVAHCQLCSGPHNTPTCVKSDSVPAYRPPEAEDCKSRSTRSGGSCRPAPGGDISKGVLEYTGPQYDYPARYNSFDWFKEPPAPIVVDPCPRRDEIPIPPIPVRYPYRYTSAGPTSFGRTKKELDVRRCLLRLKPRTVSDTKTTSDLRRVKLARGFQTTTMVESLKPYVTAVARDVPMAIRVPEGINEPTFGPYHAHSEFDQYVTDYMHPHWRKDSLYKRRILYNFKSREE